MLKATLRDSLLPMICERQAIKARCMIPHRQMLRMLTKYIGVYM